MNAGNWKDWNDFAMLLLYCAFALFTMYLITGPPLEHWLRRSRPNLSSDELHRRRDRLMFVWAIVNLIILIFWWKRLIALGSAL